jgi:hypothetical protein
VAGITELAEKVARVKKFRGYPGNPATTSAEYQDPMPTLSGEREGPPLSNDDLRLEQVRNLRMAPVSEPDVIPPSQAMYPFDRTGYAQAAALESQAAPPPDPTAGMKPWHAMLVKGLQGAAGGAVHMMEPGGYTGYLEHQQQVERQREQDLLERAKGIRAEQLQREQMYNEERNTQQARERQQQMDELTRRNIESEIRDREERKPFSASAGGTTFIPNAAGGYDQVHIPANPTAAPAAIQTYQLWASQQPQGVDRTYEGYLRAQEGIKARIAQQFKVTNPSATEFLYNLYQNDPDAFNAIANRSRIPTTEDILRLARDPLTGEIDLESARTIEQILNTGQFPSSGKIGGTNANPAQTPNAPPPPPSPPKPTSQYQRGQRIPMADGSEWEVTGFQNGEPLIRQVK